MSIAIADLAAQLERIPTADIALLAGGRIADLACGDGASTLAVALAYREALVDGFAADGAAVGPARARARAARMTGRVSFRHVDLTTVRPEALPTYDVVVAPAHLHGTAERLAGGHGVVVIRDAAAEGRAA